MVEFEEGVVEIIPPMHTPSPGSTAKAMTCLMQGCDLAHNPPKTLKRLAHALHLEPGIPDLVWHQKPLGRQSLEHQALKRPLPQFSALTPSHAL